MCGCRDAKPDKDTSGSNGKSSSNGASQLIGDQERQALTSVADPKLSVAEKLQRADELIEQGMRPAEDGHAQDAHVTPGTGNSVIAIVSSHG